MGLIPGDSNFPNRPTFGTAGNYVDRNPAPSKAGSIASNRLGGQQASNVSLNWRCKESVRCSKNPDCWGLS